MVTFVTNPLLLGYETHDSIQDDWQFQLEIVATFLIMIGAPYEHHIHHQSDDSCAH